MGTPRVWVLLGGRRGDNNQLLALAEALGWPFETKQLRYNRLRLLSKRLLGATLAVLDSASRRSLEGPFPDLVLAVGHRSVPVVRALKKRSGGKLRTVQIGNPRISPEHFDLLITTPQYAVPGAPNVLRLPISLAQPISVAPRPAATPMRLLAVGGPTAFWSLDREELANAIETLISASKRDGGRVVVSTSPRTPPEFVRSIRTQASGVEVVAAAPDIRFTDLLAEADEIFVTADSVAMISEAIMAGKPVGLVPVRKTLGGRFVLAAADALDRPAFPRDLRRFWLEVERLGLVGTVESPRSGEVPDVLAQAAERVRALVPHE